jgi:hypothetical protein
MSKAQPNPEEEAQREDEQLLAKNKTDIDEIMQLLDAGVDRAEAEKRLANARAAVEEHRKGNCSCHKKMMIMKSVAL